MKETGMKTKTSLLGIVSIVSIFLCRHANAQVLGPDTVNEIHQVQREWAAFPTDRNARCDNERNIAAGYVRAVGSALDRERLYQQQVFPSLSNSQREIDGQIKQGDLRVENSIKLALEHIRLSKASCLSAPREQSTPRVLPPVQDSDRFPPSADYPSTVARRVNPNIRWDGKGSLEATILVRCAPTGTILGAEVAQSSGNADWDNAALQAIQRTDPMPLDTVGKAPPIFSVTLRSRGY